MFPNLLCAESSFRHVLLHSRTPSNKLLSLHHSDSLRSFSSQALSKGRRKRPPMQVRKENRPAFSFFFSGVVPGNHLRLSAPPSLQLLTLALPFSCPKNILASAMEAVSPLLLILIPFHTLTRCVIASSVRLLSTHFQLFRPVSSLGRYSSSFARSHSMHIPSSEGGCAAMSVSVAALH